MTEIRTGLMKAAQDGVISDEQALRIYNDYFASAAALVRHDVDDETIVDTEVPRFIRGFHDVLITIGAVIFLSALTGLGSIFGLLPGIVILAEILVRRQRLALPAVALTIATIVLAVHCGVLVADLIDNSLPEIQQILLAITPLPVLTGIFYWRYRVPLSLAAFFVSLAAMALVLVFFVLGKITSTENFVDNYMMISASVCLVAAILLFTLAMFYDLSDPQRLTGKSDVAFWLHLVTAPALFYSILVFIFIGNGSTMFSLVPEHAYQSSGQVIVVVVVLMAIGIIIDRRAFVTSGLISLIAAVIALLNQREMNGGSSIFIALLTVGIIVLTIGIGWPHLRRFVVGLLPDAVQTKLPPVR